MGKKVKVTNKVFLETIYLQVTWLVDIYHSFIYDFIDNKNEETLK